MVMSLLANIGVVLLNIYVLWKISVSPLMQTISLKKRESLYIFIQSLTGIVLLNFSFIMLETHFNFRAVLYALTMKYLGKEIALPTIVIVGIIRFYFEGTYSAWLNSVIVLVLLLTYTWVFNWSKKKFSDFGQLLSLVYYYEIFSFSLSILALKSLANALRVSLAMIVVSSIMIFFIYNVMRDLKYLSDLSTIDGLTQLYNARKFKNDMQRFSTTSSKYGVIIIDIDNFKEINDTYGHVLGDMVLKKVASKLSFYSSGNQTVYRYGGEEFVMIIDDALQQQTQQLAEELLRTVREVVVELEDGTELNVTVSIGVTYRVGEEDLLETFTRADKFLYAAKVNGKNQIRLGLSEKYD